MFVALRLITLPEGRIAERPALVARLALAVRELPIPSAAWVAAAIDEVSLNGAHILWRMEYRTEAESLQQSLDPRWTTIEALLAECETALCGYPMVRSSVREGGPGIWRALLFRVMPAGYSQIPALESQAILVGKYVTTIRSWALNRVNHGEGRKIYTHVWEQEFDDLDGLRGEYMRHPIHWGVGDSWFNPESPNCIVDQHLSIVAGTIERSIMR